ncbi:MAG: hypothetical protein QM784_32940 [Polyangiaceae bacterium]
MRKEREWATTGALEVVMLAWTIVHATASSLWVPVFEGIVGLPKPTTSVKSALAEAKESLRHVSTHLGIGSFEGVAQSV